MATLTEEQRDAIANHLANGSDLEALELIESLRDACHEFDGDHIASGLRRLLCSLDDATPLPDGPPTDPMEALQWLVDTCSFVHMDWPDADGTRIVMVLSDGSTVVAHEPLIADAIIAALRARRKLGPESYMGRDRSKYKCDRYQDASGEWRWRITAKANGEVVGAAHEGFADPRDCDDNFFTNTGWRFDG